MKIFFNGVRGSYPIAYPDNIEFGGNTTNISILGKNKELLMIDGGTGIRTVGRILMQGKCRQGQGKGHILITHTHWDHILGLLSFTPFFVEGNVFYIYAARTECVSLKKIFEGLYDKDFFPVAFKDLPAKIVLHEINPGQSFTIDDFTIMTMQLNHPNTTLGYRISDGESIFTFITDTARIHVVPLGEGFLSIDDPHYNEFVESYEKRITDLAHKADLLVYDTHFREESIKGREHWGHSTPKDGIRIAEMAEARQLILFHHDPDEKDNDTREKERIAKDIAKDKNFDVYAAYEGLCVELPSLKHNKEELNCK